MTHTKLLPAALIGAFMLAGCEAEVTWEEEGIWECHNEFNNASVSFDTQADDTRATLSLTEVVIIYGTDIETNRQFTMKFNDGWVCTLPSGTVNPMESTPQPQ
jgi:hypothetical protein